LLCLLTLLLTTHATPHTLAQSSNNTIYLPLVMGSQSSGTASITPFGVENNAFYMDDAMLQRTQQLGVSWIRLNSIKWSEVQPTPDAAYNWDAPSVKALEKELAFAADAGLRPMVIVDNHPTWATEYIYPDGTTINPTCGPLKADAFDDYAAFLSAVVNRYKDAPYNVKYWELGNEIDVDASLTAAMPDSQELFGCWGDIDDPYYGGRHYGNMLQVVTPAIKAADPEAQVMIGGLLLDSPDSTVTNPNMGTPERFFEGILESGAANSFDIVPYHAYPFFQGAGVDADLENNKWSDQGGMILGKAQFLRNVMQQYNIEKPLFLNEASLLLYQPDPDAAPPAESELPAGFLEEQAAHVVRLMDRALGADIQVVVWYTMYGPGWRSGGLLDGNQNPRPVYDAYQQYIDSFQRQR
jgi:hypothetical protein